MDFNELLAIFYFQIIDCQKTLETALRFTSKFTDRDTAEELASGARRFYYNFAQGYVKIKKINHRPIDSKKMLPCNILKTILNQLESI